MSSLCKKPYMQGVLAFGCGQCNPCRINRRRTWAHRIMLESLTHGDSSFVTLTYDDEFLPEGGSLDPVDPQKWLKRIRKAFHPAKLRYFLVGEYGDNTFRPHYHCALFGLAPSLTSLVEETWGLGNVMVGTLTVQSAQYIAGYVTKKMTSKEDDRLCGRLPEFSRMSLRPGIGAKAMEDVADVLSSGQGALNVAAVGDVPMALNHGRNSLPLGRYLRRQLRERLGLSSDTPAASLEKWSLEMRGLFQEALSTPEGSKKSLRKILVDKNRQKVLNLEGRAKIFSSKHGGLL